MSMEVKTPQPVEHCPWCGADDRTAWGTCRACGRYYLPQGWGREPRRRRFLWWLAAGLGVIVALGAWMIFPFLPGPRILLFQRPTTQLTSNSPPHQWTMSGLNLAQNRYVATPSRPVTGRLVWSADLGLPTGSAPVISTTSCPYRQPRDVLCDAESEKLALWLCLTAIHHKLPRIPVLDDPRPAQAVPYVRFARPGV
jgi:hypothetical protein